MAKSYTKLTRVAMRKLTLGEKLTEHGITFERTKDGDGLFTVNVMVDGQRIHRVVGRESDGTTRTQAEEFISEVRSRAKHDRLALPKGRKVALSFRDAVSKYLRMLEQEGGKNISKKQRQLELHLIPFFGDMPLAKITSFDIERYKKKRTTDPVMKSNSRGTGATYKDKGASPATVNRELAVLSHLFNKGLDWGWFDRVPARIKRFKEEGGRITYLNAEQIQKLLQAAQEDQSPNLYPFIVIGLSTGMRAMEILSIRKESIDLERLVIHIPNAKAGPRDQPITKELAEFLRGYLDANRSGLPWLFPSPAARSGHVETIRKPFRRAVKAAGLDPDQVVRHTLRHTAITHLVQANVDLPTVMRISGHKTASMVVRYAHANGNHIQEAMQKLENRIKLTS